MRKIFLLLLAGLCGGALTAKGQENLVTNPGFEAGSAKAGLPAGGWALFQTVGNAFVAVDSAVAHQGSASVRLTATAAEKCVLASRKFAVAPGDGLHFSVWVRGANLPAGQTTTYAGILFRQADGKVIARRYASGALSENWSLLSGSALAPAGAASAELHLGYTNAPGTIWYDDVSATFTNAFSLFLADSAKSWPGAQIITVRVTNRQTNEFHGSVATLIGKAASSLPLTLEPKTATDLKLPITLNGIGEHPYKISLRDSRGTVVKTIQGKFRTANALELLPPCPCYELIGPGQKNVLIDAQVNLDPKWRSGLKLIVVVVDSAGREIQNATAPVSKDDITELTVSVPVAAAGDFGIRGRIIDSNGREVGAARSDIHVIGLDQAQVRVGPDGFLRVNGQPEFPIGLYSSARDKELAAAGFNTTHNYEIAYGTAADVINPKDADLKKLLDESWTNGLRMMVELPREAIDQGKWKQVRRRIETFRHHPGLLCWGSEEQVARGFAKPANTATLYALVKRLDPDHPLVLGDTRDVIEKLIVDRRDFFPDGSMDIGIWWWYPIPMQAGKAALEGNEETNEWMEPPTWLTTTHSKKPLWMAIQAYQKPMRDARFPTPAEYRCQAYLSVINGVKGLFFYCGSGQKDYAGKPSGILNKPGEGHWDYVKQLASELRQFSPVIMAPPAEGKLQLTTAGAPVEFATRELDGKIYLIAANKSSRVQQARWQGELLRNKTTTTLFEDHPVRVDGDALTDTFPAHAVHIYRFD